MLCARLSTILCALARGALLLLSARQLTGGPSNRDLIQPQTPFTPLRRLLPCRLHGLLRYVWRLTAGVEGGVVHGLVVLLHEHHVLLVELLLLIGLGIGYLDSGRGRRGVGLLSVRSLGLLDVLLLELLLLLLLLELLLLEVHRSKRRGGGLAEGGGVSRLLRMARRAIDNSHTG